MSVNIDIFNKILFLLTLTQNYVSNVIYRNLITSAILIIYLSKKCINLCLK